MPRSPPPGAQVRGLGGPSSFGLLRQERPRPRGRDLHQELRRDVEAVAALSTRAFPDAAVIDLVLEGERGRDVGRAFRQRVPGLPIVYTSGHSEAFAREGGLLGPGEALLTEPFQVGEQEDVLVRLPRERPEHPVQEG